MDFNLTEEQKSFISMIKTFGAREVTPEFLNGIKEREPKDRVPYCIEQGIIKKIHELGLKTMKVPEKYGGGGIDLLTEVVVAETLGHYCGPLPSVFLASWKLCDDMAKFGTDEQKEWFFKRVMEDANFFIGQSATEPDHGSDSRLPYDAPGGGMKTFAYRDGDEYVINGDKCFQTGASTDLLFLYCRTNKEKPLSQSMSVLLVPTDSHGYSIEKVYELMSEGMRPVCDVHFENVRVPVSNLLGEENKGYPLFEGRYMFCAAAQGVVLGQARRIYELTIDHAKTRIQGGRPIYEHPTIGTKIIEMKMSIENLQNRLYKTAWECDQAVLAGAKTYNSAEFYLCDIAAHQMQLCVSMNAAEIWGGRAALKELPIEGYIRSVWQHHHEFLPESVDYIKCHQMLEGSPYLTV